VRTLVEPNTNHAGAAVASSMGACIQNVPGSNPDLVTTLFLANAVLGVCSLEHGTPWLNDF